MPCVIWFIPLTPLRSWLCPHRIWTFHPMTNSSHQGEAMPKTTNRSTHLQTLLTQLNLGTMADIFADVALRAAKEGLSHEAYLYELARLETEQRTQRRTARLVRASGLPVEKTFRTLALNRLSPSLQLQLERLKSASFLETATNIIAIGKPGVEKSLPGSGWVCRDRGGLPRVLDAHQYACPAASSGEAGPASTARVVEIGQVCLRHSRRYRLRPA